MRKFLIALTFAAAIGTNAMAQGNQTLKSTLGKHFYIGVAINDDTAWERDKSCANLVKEQFNLIVAENCMKGENIHPTQNRYFWDDTDRFVKFGTDNGMTVIGHCLVWHSQPPKWMFTYENGDTVSRYELIDRMYHHITDVVTRYKGKIKGWDVVNEAINDDGTFRETPYYKIIGPDYFELAFKFAHAADPDAELYYNDYSMAKPAKRKAVCELIRHLKSKGCRVDAVGMQSHNGIDYPDLAEYEKSIEAFAQCGVKIHITELDLNMLPNPDAFAGAEVSQNFDYEKAMDPYKKKLTKKAQRTFDERYLAFFDIYSRHRSEIGRVTFWCVSDKNTWLNDWPIKGRTNYPLLFDRNDQMKPVGQKIMKMFE